MRDLIEQERPGRVRLVLANGSEVDVTGPMLVGDSIAASGAVCPVVDSHHADLCSRRGGTLGGLDEVREAKVLRVNGETTLLGITIIPITFLLVASLFSPF